MLKNELKILFGNKPKGKTNKYLRNEYEELKSYNDKLANDIKIARKKGDIKALTKAFKNIDRELEKELRNEVNNTVNLKFRNTSFEISNKKLSTIKNPDRYINKLYFNRTLKQIEKLIDKGKETEAKGLMTLTVKSLDQLETDPKKVAEIQKKLIKQGDRIKGFQTEKELLGDTEEESTYDVIFTSSGSTVTITVI